MTTTGGRRGRSGDHRLGLAGAPVRQASLREHNLALLLRHVAAATHPATGGPPATGTCPPTGAPPSRADLAFVTGLTRATVSTLVDDLLAGGLLTEVGPAPRTGAGRPATGLTLATDGLAGLGLEINVDYLAACVVDLSGAVRHRVVRRAELRLVPAVAALDQIADLAADARTAAERDGLRLAGTALAVPGLVSRDGVVRLAPNLGWQEVDAAAVLANEPRITGAIGFPADPAPPRADPSGADPSRAGPSRAEPPTPEPPTPGLPDPILLVENEANLAAIGESQIAGPAPASFLYVSGEIGIGAGIVLDGVLFRGARGWSGELGHVPVWPDGPICRCGARGCLEQYAGQDAILVAAGLAGPGAAAGTALSHLVELARAGDPAAGRALTDAATALGVAIAGVINMLDVDTVVLGGAYAPLAPWLIPPAAAEIRRRVLTARWAPITVRPAALGGDAAMYGAAGSVIRSVLARPAPWLGALTTTTAPAARSGRAG